LLVGETGVGKSATIMTWLLNSFPDETNMGASNFFDVSSVGFEVPGHGKVWVAPWDTVGDDGYVCTGFSFKLIFFFPDIFQFVQFVFAFASGHPGPCYGIPPHYAFFFFRVFPPWVSFFSRISEPSFRTD
jgi:hypothetical protein